jgi:hypothetical protein
MSLYQPHIATFNGKHNASKSKVLIYLNWRDRNNLPLVSAAEIHRDTGVSLNYLRWRLTYWQKKNWEYIKRKVRSQDKGPPVYVYEIDIRGRQFVLWRIPADKRNQYIQEINDWQKSQSTKTTS